MEQLEDPGASSKNEDGSDLTVYSTVTATLSQQLISVIHGNKVEFLSSILEDVTFHFIPESQIYCLTGTLNDIIKCQGCLKTLMEGLKQGLPANNIYESLISSQEENRVVHPEGNRKFDKGVSCDILKPPVVTRSGRVVKRSNKDVTSTDMSVEGLDSDSNELDEEEEVKERSNEHRVERNSKKKRGRPKKITKLADSGDSTEKDKCVSEMNIEVKSPLKSDVVKADDILHQSLTLTNALEDEFQNTDSLKGSTEGLSSSGSFDLRDLGLGAVKGKPQSLDTSDNDTQEKDSLTSEVGRAVQESLQNVYLNKSVTDRVKLKKGKKNSHSNEVDGEKIDTKKIKQTYEKKMPFKYFCTKCSYKSKRESHFKIHKRIHMTRPDMPVYKCDQCDFTAIRQSVLHKHKISHSDNFLSCNSCEYKTNNALHLANHIKNRHESKTDTLPSNDELFSCNVCPYRTKRYSTYTKHFLSHGLTFSASEDGTVLTFKCNLCLYKTHRKEHLVRHKSDVHGNNRPYLCDLCGMAFKRIDALAAHKLTHLDKSQRSLPFKCTTCKKAFKSRAHLKEHLAVHTSARAYLCDICGVSFKTKAVQKKHQQNIHLNPGSFKCSTCPKAFNTKYALQRHIQHHQYGSPYKSSRDATKVVKKDEIQADLFGVEGEGHLGGQGQGDELQVQEVQLQFHLQDYAGQVTLVPEDGQLVSKDDGQRLQIIEGQELNVHQGEGHEFNDHQVEDHELEGQLLEQVQDENIDENLTAIQTITLPSSQLRQLTHPVHTTGGDEIYFTTDDGNSFGDPTREAVRQLFIPSSIDGQTSVIEVDGSTTFIQEIQGAESLIEEVKNLGALEGMQTNHAILTINTDGIEKVFVANVNSGDVENL